MKYKLSCSEEELKNKVSKFFPDATGIGGSLCKDDYTYSNHYHCSCGWSGGRPRKEKNGEVFCPECGGRLLKVGSFSYIVFFEISGENNNTLEIKRIRLGARLKDKEMDVIEDVVDIAAYYRVVKKGKTFIHPKYIPTWHSYISSEELRNVDAAVEWGGEDLKAAWKILYKESQSYEVFEAYSYFPYIFTKENLDKEPKLCSGIYNVVEELIDWSRRKHIPPSFIPLHQYEDDEDSYERFDANMTIDDFMELCGVPRKLINKNEDIEEVCFLVSYDSLFNWVRTDLGQRIFAKYKHGNISLQTFMHLSVISMEFQNPSRKGFPYHAYGLTAMGCEYADNFNYNLTYRTTSLTGLEESEKACWPAFLLDTIDQYGEDKMYREFFYRIKTMRKLGIQPTDDSIRTKPFSALRNSNISGPFILANNNMDKDPLGSLLGMKFNLNYRTE